MKPYLYILGVLLVGGGIGYFVGRQMNAIEKRSQESALVQANPQAEIREIFERQVEAYRLHDPLLLYRDCGDAYVEINSNTGESYGLSRAVMVHLDEFKAGKSVTLNILSLEIDPVRNSAIAKASYSKTSEVYEQQGLKGLVGQGTWILSKVNNHWRINAFAWSEEVKQ